MRNVLAASLVLALGLGCNDGGGCALKPLPADPKPFGLPSDQIIEGGIQARLSKPGVDKLVKLLVDLLNQQGNKGFCAIPEGSIWCHNKTSGCDPGKGCTATLNVEKVDVVVQDGSPVDIVATMTFDYDFPVDLAASVFACTLDTYSATPNVVRATIEVGTDAATGEISLELKQLENVHIDVAVRGCAVLGDILNFVGRGIDWLLSSFGASIGNGIRGLITPALEQFVKNFLPKPLGLAGSLDTGALLTKYDPPKDAHLELLIVPGGYVSAKSGGISLGVVAGANADRDQSTRAPGLASEPSLCVPTRPIPDLVAPPWNLPSNVARNDFSLNPAGTFSGDPEPIDASGKQQDVAIGMSRAFLDLAGFHLYNSGTMCMSIGGDALPLLTAGTLGLIVPSLQNIIDDPKSPLALALRPTTPPRFTIGVGDATNPLVRIGLADMRVDFYGWVEERWARLFTIGADLDVGINLTVTKDPTTMAPKIQPMLSGFDAQHVTVRVSNTDLLAEKPEDLAAVFPSLLSIATDALGGAIPAVSLPTLSGFSLESLSVGRVQTPQDDFVTVFGTIKTGSPEGLIDWSDPSHPHAFGEPKVRAEVVRVDVPTAAELARLFGSGKPSESARPRVTLRLSTQHAAPAGTRVEYAWRVDGGMWRAWSFDTQPVIADDALLLQGLHLIELRSRVEGDWSTEDGQPAQVAVRIDSVPPELHPALDARDSNVLKLGGLDLVSDESALVYRWQRDEHTWTDWADTDRLSVREALRLTAGARRPLLVEVRDEAGLVTQTPVDVADLTGFHSTNPMTTGCGLGGTTRTGLAPLALITLLLGSGFFLRRRTGVVMRGQIAQCERREAAPTRARGGSGGRSAEPPR